MRTLSCIQKSTILLLFAFTAATALSAQTLESDQVTKDFVSKARHQSGKIAAHNHLSQGSPHAGIPNIDSVVNFSGQYIADGFDFFNNPNKHWDFNMVGNRPEHGGTTTINAPIVPVSLDLRNADGSPRFVNGQRLFYDATQFVQPVLNSPIFQNATYSSSNVPTQFVDAVQKAEFYDKAKPDWHTLLAPSVKPGRTMVLNKGTYLFALNDDGTCCAFVLVDFFTFETAFLPDFNFGQSVSTPVGDAEVAGDITTQDISTFLFPNTFLFTDNDLNFFTVGFHTYDFEPGDDSNGNVEKRYVLNYSSWVSPFVFFGDNFEDVTPLSHELSETFNDPFVGTDSDHGITPWWLAPNGGCQNLMEVGDVVEDLPGAAFPMTMNGLTYHPQNEALLPWFEFQSPSRAIHGAYSYPDENLLTTLSPVEHVFCQ